MIQLELFNTISDENPSGVVSLDDLYGQEEICYNSVEQVIARDGVEDVMVPFFKEITKPNEFESISLDKLVEIIKSDEFKPITEKIRSLPGSVNKHARNDLKKLLPVTTFSNNGARVKDAPIEHTNLLCIDIDNLEISKVSGTRELLVTDKRVKPILAFISPSGNGLKLVYHINTTDSTMPNYATHKEWFRALVAYLNKNYDLSVYNEKKRCYGSAIDESGKDERRACYLPYDGTVYYEPKNSYNSMFEPKEWIKTIEENKEVYEKTKETISYSVVSEKVDYDEADYQHVDEIVKRIESQCIDITSDYNDWLKCAYAFLNTFGKDGEDFFVRVSKFYPSFDEAACRNQYNACSRNVGQGDIGMFVNIAKKYGIDVSKSVQCSNVQSSTMQNLPVFSSTISDALPKFFGPILDNAKNDKEKDILLLSSISTLSSVFYNVKTLYAGQELYPNLFFFLVGAPASGKGVLSHCYNLVESIHQMFKDEYNKKLQNYKIEYSKFIKEEDGVEPVKPTKSCFVHPGNITAADLISILQGNNGIGLFMETEGDTLANAIKGNYGGFSDVLRKGFEGERITKSTKGDEKILEVENPKFAVVISGTPTQFKAFLKDGKDGLASRFLPYYLEHTEEWLSPFENQINYREIFDLLGKQVYDFYLSTYTKKDTLFDFTKEQQKKFNHLFTMFTDNYCDNEFMTSSLHRLGKIFCKLCMVITIIRRCEDKRTDEDVYVCDDIDFNIVCEIIKVMTTHIEKACMMLTGGTPSMKGSDLFAKLANTFQTKDVVAIGGTLGMDRNKVNRLLRRWANDGNIVPQKHGEYTKMNNRTFEHLNI